MVGTPERVVLHPLVLLSVVDHYNRVSQNSQKRVVGALLGSSRRGVIDVTNSFAGESTTPSPSSFSPSPLRGRLQGPIHMVSGP